MSGKTHLQSESDKDQEKGDEVLRRLLKTPPQPRPEPKDHERSKSSLQRPRRDREQNHPPQDRTK